MYVVVMFFSEIELIIFVDCFYEQVCCDVEFGLVFNLVVYDWNEYKQLLILFWCLVVCCVGSYCGNLMVVYQCYLVCVEYFDCWFMLWCVICVEVLDVSGVVLMIDYVECIGQSLKFGLGLCLCGCDFGVLIVVQWL